MAADERLRGQVVASRRYLHQIRGELQAVTGTLEMIRAEGDLPMPHQQEIGDAVERLGAVAALAEQLHQIVRGMAPP